MPTRKRPSSKAATHRPAKRKQGAPRTATQYNARPERFKAMWDRVITTVSQMRSQGSSLQQAARDSGVSPRTVKRWAGSALHKRANGKWIAKKKDNLLRVLMVPTSDGTHEIAVRGSGQATQLAEYWNAVRRYLQTGDESRLRKFRGKSIKDANGKEMVLLTDRKTLNRLGAAGVFSFETLYARSA